MRPDDFMTESSTERFERLALPHLAAAYSLARWLTRDERAAEDVVQEAYLRAFRFFRAFRGEDARPWLLAIVRNSARTWFKAVEAGRSQDEFDEEIHSEEAVLAPHTAQALGNPLLGLLQRERRSTVNSALEQMPVAFREVLVLRELEELSYKEIAQVLDVPVGTVMSRLARARSLLAQLLAGEEERPR
jgi:RNA polymerase sigma-70 factor, ECF subfamily